MVEQKNRPVVLGESNWRQRRTDPIVLSTRIEPDQVVLQLGIPADLFQLQGHFPQMAIVPGVAQLDWAWQYAQQYFQITGALRQVTQLKYRRVLRPGDAVALSLTRAPGAATVKFSFAGPAAHYSSGNLKLGPP